MQKKLLPLLALLTFLTLAEARAQIPDKTSAAERIIFNVTAMREYDPTRQKPRQVAPQAANAVLVFRHHEVRYSSRLRGPEHVYTVNSIRGRRHFKIATWNCGNRIYTLSTKKHLVTMSRRDTSQTIIFYGSVNSTAMFK